MNAIITVFRPHRALTPTGVLVNRCYVLLPSCCPYRDTSAHATFSTYRAVVPYRDIISSPIHHIFIHSTFIIQHSAFIICLRLATISAPNTSAPFTISSS